MRSKGIFVVILALSVASLAAYAAAGRAMTIADLITAVRVSEPALSPDGRLVAYVRTTTNPQTGRRNPDLFLVPSDGSAPPKLLLGGESPETTPVFSPDGKQLAFISVHDGAAQVYVMSMADQKLRQVTKLAAGVQGPLVFSPDGTRVAFVSDVYPDCADEACNARRAEAAAKNPVKVHHIKRLLYRHWSDWREELRHHLFVADVATGATRDLTPGDFDSPPFFYEDSAISFSPDGKQIAFVSNRESADAQAWSTNQDVWIVAVSGGEAKRLTTNKAADVEPVWSPDGKSIVTRSQRRAGFESDRWYLEVHDVAAGQHRPVFETPDISVDHFKFARDGRSIVFLAQDRGSVAAHTVPFPSGTPRVITKGGAIAGFDVGQDFLVMGRHALAAPTDLYRVSLSGEVKQLTRENEAWLKEVAFEPAQSLTVSGAGGTPVQYWLIKPPNFDAAKRYPVVFMIHGGPQSAWLDAWSTRWNPQLWAAQGWVIAAPNPRGSTGFGQKFVDEISQDWCGKVMTDINAVVDTVAKLPYVDGERMGIAGASYGGYAVNWIIGQTNRYKAAVSHDGLYHIESFMGATEELWFPEWEFGGPVYSPAARKNMERCSPHRFAQNMKTPTLIITNELDYRVPVDQGLQLFTALRRQGVPSEMLVFPDEGHWVLRALNSKYWHEQVFGWLERHLRS